MKSLIAMAWSSFIGYYFIFFFRYYQIIMIDIKSATKSIGSYNMHLAIICRIIC